MKASLSPDDGPARTLTAVGIPPASVTRFARLRLASRQLVLPMGMTTLLLAALGYDWLWFLNLAPNVAVPMPKMPVPNAFDYFCAAGKQIKHDNSIGDAISNKQPRLDQKITQPPGSPFSPSTAQKLRDPNHYYSLAEKEALVNENAGALKLLRQGLPYPYLNPPARNYNQEFPYYNQFRSLARLLTLEGQVRAAHSNWVGAVNSGLDAMQMGAQMPHGSIVIGKLVGLACEAIGRKPLWTAIDHLNATQTLAAEKQMEHIRALYVPFADALQEEKWYGQAAMQAEFLRPNWRQELTLIPNDQADLSKKLLLYLKLLPYSKRQILDNYTRYMDQSILNARLFYATYPAPAPPEDPISQFLAPDYANEPTRDLAGGQVQDALLQVTLALHAYRLDHGHYPQALVRLVPKYMSTIPEDPFAMQDAHGRLVGRNRILTGLSSDDPVVMSAPLRYRRTERKYVLYSIGPDGEDNGGQPIQNPAEPKDSPKRYRIEPDSDRSWATGDIVAGINLD